jgi:phosphoglycolate phosphatase-like HAD superfamily hydrolase
MANTTIALIFDFDDTLAADATSALLASRGVDLAPFWDSVKALYQSGWDPVPAYLFKVLEESRTNTIAGPITRDVLQAAGRSVSFFSGVETLFERLRTFAANNCPAVTLEFYLVSSGIAELLRATPIASNFKNIWACDYSFNDVGEISYPKNIVSFTDKTRYIFQIAKGIVGADAHGQPFAVNKAVPEDALRVPFSHMIFVGDGYTDIPCFSLVRSKGGVAFGVYDPNRPHTWAKAWGYVADNRVSNLVPADYSESGALWHNLQMAIAKIASDISLQQRAYQG